MKHVYALLLAVMAGLSGIAYADETDNWNGVVSQDTLPASIEDLAFEWENFMMLSMVGPCPDSFVHGYRNEGHYGEQNSDYRLESGLF